MYEVEGAPLTAEDIRLFGRYQRPLPVYSLEQIKQMAREKGESTAGSKRDIIKRLL